MKFETFFKNFDLLADAPNAIPKLRSLILTFAVQGKLVRRIVAEGLGSDILKVANVTEVPPDAVPQLPNHWVWASLGSIATRMDSGWSPACNSEPAEKDEWGILKTTAVQTLQYQEMQNKVLPPNLKPRPEHEVIDGDILFTRAGPMNRVGILCVARPTRKKLMISDKIIRFHLVAGIDPNFAALSMNAGHSSSVIEGLKSGMAASQVNISQPKLRSVPIPLPPLEEQRRIVAKVDELMALCDRLEARQQEREARHADLARAALARFADAPTPANLELLFHPAYTIPPADLRKSILTLAVQGKLVPQDPNDEPIDELLAQSLIERRKLKRTVATEVRPLAVEDALGYDIPVSWRWQRLDDLLIFGPTNGFSPKAVDYETPVRSLTLSATTSGRFKGEHSKFITTDVSQDSDLWLRDGDILVQRGNTIEYVGVAAVYRGEPNCFVYPDLMMKLRVSSVFDVGFIHLAMSHEAARDFLRARASGTSGSMPKINQTTLKNLPLPIPPLAEQKRIVAKVEQLMGLVDMLEGRMAAAREGAAKLLDAVVAELTA